MRLISRMSAWSAAVAKDFVELGRRQHAFQAVRPITATIFLTYRCNSRCATCTLWKRPHHEEKRKEIDLDGWRIVIDRLRHAGIRSVEVFGGNVLLRKRLLIGILHYLKESGFTIHLPTNQIGLDDEIAEAIIACVDFVYISTDGVGVHQDSIRGLRGSAKRAEGAITRLARLRAAPVPPPKLVCNTTVSRHNVDILQEVAAYAEKSGFDEIHFEYCGEFTREHVAASTIDGLLPTPYFLRQGNESILLDSAGARRLKDNVHEIRQLFSGTRFNVLSTNVDVLTEEHLCQGTIPHGRCYVERTETTIDPSGNLIACPFINNYVIGNLVTHDFSTVWNNARHRRFRQVQNTLELAVCQHCILGVQRNPGVWTSLKRIYLNKLSGLTYRRRTPDRERDTSARV